LSPDLHAAARQLFLSNSGETVSADRVATQAVDALSKVALHLGRVVGGHGSFTIFRRALSLCARKFAWLPATSDAGDLTLGDPFPAVREAMKRQAADAVIDAFVHLLSSYTSFLGRLIGDELVWRLLDEVWPSIFPQAVKEPS
jgi:hypothetical protein